MADRETLGVYGARARQYDDLKPSQLQEETLDAFMARLPPGGHILDLGCGPGLQSAQMQAAGFRVTAYDATPEFVDAARLRGVDAHLARFEDLDSSNAFDGVFASFSLLHAPKADFPGHLAACHSALIPGGLFFLGMKLGAGEGRDALGRFYAYYSEADLRAALDTAGFTGIEAITGTGPGLAGTDDPYILITARKP